MSFDYNYQSLDAKLIGTTTTIPNNRLAKLMYYLHCVCAVVQYDGIDRLTDYRYYNYLSNEEEQTVIGLVSIFNPSVMTNLGLFIVDPRFVPSGSRNEFFQLTDSRLGFHVNSEVIIGGVSRKVLKIMTCISSWLDDYYWEPMASYTRPRLPPSTNRTNNRTNNNNDNCCECLEKGFDHCCCCLDCQCPSYCKKCWCLIFILYFFVGPIFAIIINSAHK